MMDWTDLTDRAVAGGWELPDGWTVTGLIEPDLDTTPDEYDCYTPKQQEAWRRDDWTFVVVIVEVTDDNGRDWGRNVLGGVEAGWFTLTTEDDEITGQEFIDPLDDKPSHFRVIREHDMIGEALRNAVTELERFGTPVIAEPVENYSGL